MSGVSLSTRFFSVFHFGFWIRGPFSSAFSLAFSLPSPQTFLFTIVVFCFPVLLSPYIIRSPALYISVGPSHAYSCLLLRYKLVIIYTRL